MKDDDDDDDDDNNNNNNNTSLDLEIYENVNWLCGPLKHPF